MKRTTFVAALAAAGMILSIAGYAAPPPSPFLLQHGAIVDPAGGAAYVAKPNGTIDAVDLASGRTRWTSAEAALPLGLDQNLLVAQVEEKPEPTERFHLVVLDAAGGGKLNEATVTLPAGVRALVADEKGISFRATAEREGTLFLVSWYYQELLVEPIPPKPGDTPLRLYAGSVRINPQTGKIIAADGGQMGAVPARWKTYGALPQAPWQAGAVSARAEGGRGGPLTLKRMGAGGAALPDQPLSKRALIAVPSADQRHLLATERVGQGGPDDPEYRWLIFTMDAAQPVMELRRDVSAAPFFVFSDSIVLVSQPQWYLRGGVRIDEPLQLQASRVSTGVATWNVELRDLNYRGELPLRRRRSEVLK